MSSGLVLTRCVGQTIIVEGGIEITLTSIDSRKQARILIKAPGKRIWRKEVLEKLKEQAEKETI